MLHKNMVVGDNHILHNWEVASFSALQALSVLSTDIGKIARRTDDGTFWVLQNNVGPVWKQLITSEGSGSGTSVSLDQINQLVDRNHRFAISRKSVEAKIFSYQQLS